VENINDPEMVALAQSMNNPRLLLCDTPLDNSLNSVISAGDLTAGVLDWLSNHDKWSTRINDCLQCLAEDSEGRRLLTAFMPVGDFEQMADDMAASGFATDLPAKVAQWRELGAVRGYFEGYSSQAAVRS
jgi:hypothetical protein